MKTLIAFLGLFLASHFVQAQANYSDLQKAFTSSYIFESKADYNAAINALKKPEFADSYEINLRLGWLYYLQGEHKEAIKYYEKASQNKPLSIESLLGAVYPATALGNWDTVKGLYERVLKIDPKHSTTNYYLALLLYNRKDYTNAKKYAESLVNHYPFDFDGNALLGSIYEAMNQNVQAKTLYQKALLIQPTNEMVKKQLEGLK